LGRRVGSRLRGQQGGKVDLGHSTAPAGPLPAYRGSFTRLARFCNVSTGPGHSAYGKGTHKMYRLSAACLAGLALLPMACGTGAPKHDAQIASSRGFRLVLEMVCMPVVLDGQDFATAARARGMTPMAPASSPSGAAAQ